ncbi:MAG: hypothetical protein JO325_09220 [Solirubrobacterales bacterium]|nr:hypothetical protein [Solirubrobacterales bacterium]
MTFQLSEHARETAMVATGTMVPHEKLIRSWLRGRLLPPTPSRGVPFVAAFTDLAVIVLRIQGSGWMGSGVRLGDGEHENMPGMWLVAEAVYQSVGAVRTIPTQAGR